MLTSFFQTSEDGLIRIADIVHLLESLWNNADVHSELLKIRFVVPQYNFQLICTVEYIVFLRKQIYFGKDNQLRSFHHTSYLSREPWEFSCKFFLAGVNFYRFNAKNWQFTVYFVVMYVLFRCKFYSPKILIV